LQKNNFWHYLKHKEINFVPRGKLRWWLLGLIVLGWAVEQYEALKNGPVLVYILEDFDKTLIEWGYVAAGFGFVYSLGAVVLSRIGDRFGRRPLMIWPVFAYAVISVCGALTDSFWTLAALVATGTFLMAGMNPAVHAASRDLTPRMGRAMVYAWVSLAFTIGALMSTAVAAQTLPIWPGWRSQYWIAAGLAGLTAFIIFLFYRDLSLRIRGKIQQSLVSETPTGEAATQASQAYDDGRQIYRSSRLWLLSSVIVFWSLTYVTVSAYVPTFLAQHHHLDPARAAAVTSFFWIVFTVSVFISGWLSDKLCVRKSITAFGGITTGLCFIYGANLPVDADELTLTLVWSATGFFAGFIYPAWCAIYSETAESVSPFGVARAFGITATLSPVAGLFLNLGLPQVVDKWGWSTWMMIAGGCCFCVSFLVAFGKGPWWVPAHQRGLLSST
jgi:MFS family permease